jgi:UDP-N-acetylglucosamine acyltransferase
MIDQRAIVDKNAEIAPNVKIGPYAIIGKNVEIGEGSWVGPHAVIEGRTKIGKNNQIFHMASIGAIPQDKKYHGEDTILEIGDNNIFREFCTINLGTVQGGGITKIGNGNLFMNYSHVAHDCVVGNETVFSNNASLAGHVIVGDFTIFGGFVKVAQFVRIGAYSFFIGGADIGKDVLPYVIAGGDLDTAKLYGLNLIGLKRHGFSEQTLTYLKDAYNIILRKKLTVVQAIPELEAMLPVCPEVQLFIDMLNQSERGILRLR